MNSHAKLPLALPTRLLAQGVSQTRGGHQPIRLNDPEQIWWIRSGSIELFLVSQNAEGTEGMRHYLASLPVGSLLLGLPTDPTTGFTLLAVPHPDTELVHWDRAWFQAQVTDEDVRATVAPALELWLRALSWGMSRWATPRPVIEMSVAPEETLPLPASKRLAGRQELAWIQLSAGSAIFLDMEDLPDPETDIAVDPALPRLLTLPLAPEAWILSTRAVTVAARSTEQALSDNDAWSGADHLHQMLFSTALMNLRLANVDEYNRLEASRRHNDEARERAFASLLTVHRRPPHLDNFSVRHDESPLLSALRLLGRETGFNVEVPANQEAGTTVTLEEIVRASRLRQRRITLRGAWWKNDFGALLAFHQETREPLVLLYGDKGRPRALNPRTAEELPFAEVRDQVSPQAWEFSAPWPFVSLRFGSVLATALRYSWRDLALLMVMGVLGALITLAVPITTAYLINSAIPNHELSLLIQIGGLLLALGASAFVVSWVGALAFSRAEGRIGRRIQSGLMDRVLRLPARFFQDYTSGDLAMRALAMIQVQQMLSVGVMQAMLSGVFGSFSLLLMFYYDVWLAFWAMLLALAYLASSLLITYFRLRRERLVAQMTGTLSHLLLQMILGAAKIRLAAAEERAFARWATLFARSRGHQLASQRLAAWQSALNNILLLSGLLLFIVLLGKPSESPNLIAIGFFAALLIAFQQFASALTTMLAATTGLIAMQPQIERAAPILANVPEVTVKKADPGTLSGAVEITAARFRYRKDGPLILDDVSLTVSPGEFIALVGSSGSGKSTLLRLLLGFEELESGGILFDGQELSGLDATAVRRQMGVVMQNARLMPRSLFENIVGTGNATLADAWEAAEQVGLADDIRSFPMGMQTLIMEGGGALSGGQMQRLMIARAIVSKPRILLLDEATSALDNRAQSVVTKSLDQLRVTRIVVAHRLSTVMNADRIYVMDAGKIVEAGTYASLIAAGGRFARLAERQIV